MVLVAGFVLRLVPSIKCPGGSRCGTNPGQSMSSSNGHDDIPVSKILTSDIN